MYQVGKIIFPTQYGTAQSLLADIAKSIQQTNDVELAFLPHDVNHDFRMP